MAYPQEMPTTAAAGEQQGFEICIRVRADGGVSVSSEPLEADDMGAGQEVESIGEAMKLAMQMYQEGGATTADDDFAAGFGAGPQEGAPPVERGMRED